MIAADGTIEYARPSHQDFLIKKAMELQGWSREELMSACPPDYYGDFMAWLHPVSGGYIPVWAEGVMNIPITGKQVAALKNLKLHGLFRGRIPKANIQ